MKKGIVILFIIMVIAISGAKSSEDTSIVIPANAIRFRIIASSNTIEDQNEKYNIKKDLDPTIASILSKSNNINDARYLIKSNMNNITNVVNKYTNDYNINYGLNYFPEKTYKGITYPEGDYESLVITLGNGQGDNWWCVLFPPLCLLEASADELDDVTYSFYIQDIIAKF